MKIRLYATIIAKAVCFLLAETYQVNKANNETEFICPCIEKPLNKVGVEIFSLEALTLLTWTCMILEKKWCK